MKIFLATVLSSLIIISSSFSQDQEGTSSKEKKKSSFTLLFGGAAGNFGIDASKFNSIYSNRSISRIYVAGIGGSELVLLAKYRQFFAHGRSMVQNVDVKGKAEWKQKFYSAGIRLFSGDFPLYADLLYVVTKADETITTDDPVMSELTEHQEIENKGGGFALGFTMTILGPIKIFGEGEYSFMVKKAQNKNGTTIPELGGLCASAGVVIIL